MTYIDTNDHENQPLSDDRPSLAEYREDLRRARRTDAEKAAEQAQSEAIWAEAAR